jgi:excisionase family DNA binding protein
MVNSQTIKAVNPFIDLARKSGVLSDDQYAELQTGLTELTKTKAEKEELWRTVEACKFLKCSKPTLLDQARKKGLQIISVGNTLRFRRSEILKLVGLN